MCMCKVCGNGTEFMLIRQAQHMGYARRKKGLQAKDRRLSFFPMCSLKKNKRTEKMIITHKFPAHFCLHDHMGVISTLSLEVRAPAGFSQPYFIGANKYPLPRHQVFCPLLLLTWRLSRITS